MQKIKTKKFHSKENDQKKTKEDQKTQFALIAQASPSTWAHSAGSTERHCVTEQLSALSQSNQAGKEL